MYFFDVNSCLYFRNVVHAALILLLISSVSCCRKRFSDPNIHAFALCQYFDVHITDFHVSFCVRVHAAFIAENFRLVWVNR